MCAPTKRKSLRFTLSATEFSSWLGVFAVNDFQSFHSAAWQLESWGFSTVHKLSLDFRKNSEIF